jgi:hypothetical protein
MTSIFLQMEVDLHFFLQMEVDLHFFPNGRWPLFWPSDFIFGIQIFSIQLDEICKTPYFFKKGRRPQFFPIIIQSQICSWQPRELIFGVQPKFNPTRWTMVVTQIFVNGRRPQPLKINDEFIYFLDNLNGIFKWRTTSMFLWMENFLQKTKHDK